MPIIWSFTLFFLSNIYKGTTWLSKLLFKIWIGDFYFVSLYKKKNRIKQWVVCFMIYFNDIWVFECFIVDGYMWKFVIQLKRRLCKTFFFWVIYLLQKMIIYKWVTLFKRFGLSFNWLCGANVYDAFFIQN